MNNLLAKTIALALLASTSAYADSMQVTAESSRASIRAPEANFTGSVLIDPLYAASEHTQNVGGHVTFAPGARSAWHTHPAGQVLIVTAGTGWVQEEGAEKKVMRSGDVIWTPPGVKHWHGATDTNGMRHIAVTNVRDGKNVDWMEKVSDEQYLD